jgi:hypothetical protein
MYKFKVLAHTVRAVQINKSGEVDVDGKKLVGDIGYWIVIDENTNEQTLWPDSEFRKNFAPADDSATEYLRQAIKK